MTAVIYRSPLNKSKYSSLQSHFWFSKVPLVANLILWHRKATNLWFCHGKPSVFNCYNCHAAVLATRLYWSRGRNSALLKGNMEAVKSPLSTLRFFKKGWGCNFDRTGVVINLRVVRVLNCWRTSSADLHGGSVMPFRTHGFQTDGRKQSDSQVYFLHHGVQRNTFLYLRP